MTQHRPLRLTDVGRRDLAFVRCIADRIILRGQHPGAEHLHIQRLEPAEAWARIEACRKRWFADPKAIS